MAVHRFLNPPNIAPPRGYTHVVETKSPSRTIYLSGQLGMTPDGKFAGAPGDYLQGAYEVRGVGLALGDRERAGVRGGMVRALAGAGPAVKVVAGAGRGGDRDVVAAHGRTGGAAVAVATGDREAAGSGAGGRVDAVGLDEVGGDGFFACQLLEPGERVHWRRTA